MSTDPNREIVIRSVRRSWGLLMKRLIHLSAGGEQPFPAAGGGGGGCGDSLSIPGSGIEAAIFLPRWMVLSLQVQAGLEGKRKSVVSGELDVVVFLAGICPRTQELGELLSGACRSLLQSPSSSSSLIPVPGCPAVPLPCNAQAHLGSAADPIPQPCCPPELGQTPQCLPGGCRHI